MESNLAFNSNTKNKLDVGGNHFTTTLGTLTRVKESMLGAMFSGRYALEPSSEDGSYFFDRDGTHFRHILNFLRDQPTFTVDHMSQSELIELRREAEYYGLDKVMFSTPTKLISDKDWEKIYSNWTFKQDHSGMWYAHSPSTAGLLITCKVCHGAWIANDDDFIEDFTHHRRINANQPTVGPKECIVCPAWFD